MPVIEEPGVKISETSILIWPFGGKANRRLAILDTDKKDFELRLYSGLYFNWSALGFGSGRLDCRR